MTPGIDGLQHLEQDIRRRCGEQIASAHQRKCWTQKARRDFETRLLNLQQDCAMEEAALQCCRNVVAELRRLLPVLLRSQHVKVEVYGSIVMGTPMHDSDLDVSVSGAVPQQLLDDVLGWHGGTDGADADTAATHSDAAATIELESLSQFRKAALLRHIQNGLAEQGLHELEESEVIATARVPILKFAPQGCDVLCELSIGNQEARCKSVVVGWLTAADERVRACVSAIKLWARTWDINDASASSINSFALTLMTIFALQVHRPHAVLPPLWCLFHPHYQCNSLQRPFDDVSTSCKQLMQTARKQLDSFEQFAAQRASSHSAAQPALTSSVHGANNLCRIGDSKRASHSTAAAAAAPPTATTAQPPSVLDLLLTFFAAYRYLIVDEWWRDKSATAVRVSTWAGDLVAAPFHKAFILPIEDPFLCNENAARAVGSWNPPYDVRRVQDRVKAAVQACTSALLRLKLQRDVDNAMFTLFAVQPSQCSQRDA